MKVKIFNNKKIQFTEKDYKILKRRFNYKNYKKVRNEYGDDEYILTLSCPLCDKFHRTNSCISCPVNIFKKNELSGPGCMILIYKILRIPIDDKKGIEFYATQEDVGYLQFFEEEAKKQLDKLNKFLDTFE